MTIAREYDGAGPIRRLEQLPCASTENPLGFIGYGEFPGQRVNCSSNARQTITATPRNAIARLKIAPSTVVWQACCTFLMRP